MSQWRAILLVTIVALAAAAIWTRHEVSEQGDATLAREQPSAPVAQPPVSVPVIAAATESSTAVPAAPPAQPATVASDVEAPAAVDLPPQSVDTPEPAQAKFARGGRLDPDQN